MCLMSRVTCHMTGFRCQVSFFSYFFDFLYKVVELGVGGSVINGPIPSSFNSEFDDDAIVSNG